MFTFLKEFCGVCYETPKEGWQLIKLIVGTTIIAIAGCIVIGFIELHRKIKGV
jgi:hypothetical protein